MSKFQITSQPALRDLFWEAHPEFKRGSSKTTQNDYSTDIRCAWVDYVDHCNRDGTVSDKLSQSATL